MSILGALLVAVILSLRTIGTSFNRARIDDSFLVSMAAENINELSETLFGDTSDNLQGSSVNTIDKVNAKPTNRKENRNNLGNSYLQNSTTSFRPFIDMSRIHHCVNEQGENVSMPAHFPAFIIFGAQKGGTTALSGMLKHHPNVMSVKRGKREPHFFDFHVTKNNAKFIDPAFLCHTRQRYLQEYFNINDYNRRVSRNTTIFAFEKTPSYIRYVGTAYRTFQTMKHDIKVIAVLRNPVERSYSSYKMEHLRHQPLAESFDSLVAAEVEALRTVGLSLAHPLPFANATASTNIRFLPAESLYSFAPVNLTFAERRSIVHTSKTPQKGKMKKMKDNSLYAGMYATQLSEWLQYYTLHEHMMVIRSEELQSQPRQVLQRVQEFLGLPYYEFPVHVMETEYNPIVSPRQQQTTLQRPQIRVDRPSPATEEYMKQFYRPYNDDLANLLGEEWRGVWDDG